MGKEKILIRTLKIFLSLCVFAALYFIPFEFHLTLESDMNTTSVFALRESLAEDVEDIEVNHHQRMPAFYIYDDGINWTAILCLKGKEVLSVEEALHTTWWKHSDDFWFLRHALEHPARVRDPELAEVFVVGGLFNLIVEQKAWSQMRCCVGAVCNEDLLQKVDNMLGNSTWFKRSQGRDHVLVASHYASRKTFRHFESISKCNWIAWEHNGLDDERLRLASTYVGNGCESTISGKTHDVAFVGSMKNKTNFHSRHDVCGWLQKEPHRWHVSVCGEGRQCPALAEARIGLHLRGDTLGSSRLMDILLSNSVPVMTEEQQYDILPPFLPWRKMTAFAAVDTKEHFFETLDKLDIWKVEKFNKENRISAKLDWRNKYLFEQYMKAFYLVSSRLSWKELLLQMAHLPSMGETTV